MVVYKKYILNIYSLVWISLLLLPYQGYSQTCCSGGVPLSGNIGFTGAETGTLQAELSYDLNYLVTLKDGSEVYEGNSRRRITQSLLLKSGYSISRWLAVDALFSYVFQERRVSVLDQTFRVSTRGVGDAVILPKFTLSNITTNGNEIQLGLGLKVPLGRTDLKDERGITLNADLQPGSGSWDMITWTYYARQFMSRPSMVVSARILVRFNGMNRGYLGSQTYQFGQSGQVYLSLGDQLVIGNKIFAPSLSLRFRGAAADRINGQDLENTGGQWINVIPALSWHITQNTILHLVPEIPLYSKVNGIQLTPSFRMQMGIYYRFGQKKEDKSKTYIL